MTVRRIFTSASDFANLSRAKTVEAPPRAEDYSSVIVNKPWGFEYLFFETPRSAGWLLSISQDRATSTHCHVIKKTSLVVLSGAAVCRTLDGDYRLGPGDVIVFHPKVFHSTRAVAPGTWVLEIETPVLKGDLVRLADAYGRAGTAYEGKQHHQTLDPASFPRIVDEKPKTIAGWTFQRRSAVSTECQRCALIDGEPRPVNRKNAFLADPLGEVFTSATLPEFSGDLSAVPGGGYLVFDPAP